MVAGPEVSRMITEFEHGTTNYQYQKGNHLHLHHDQQPSVQAAFVKDVRSLTTTFVTVYRKTRAQHGVRKYREKIDRFLKNVLFQAEGRERLGLL